MSLSTVWWRQECKSVKIPLQNKGAVLFQDFLLLYDMKLPVTNKHYNQPVAWLLLLSLSCIWGSSFILMKKGLQALTPIEVGALRVVAAAIFFLPFSAIRLRKLTFRQYQLLFVSGLLGTFFPALIYAYAQAHIDSAIAGAFSALTPISVLAVGALFFRQKILKNEVIGIILGIVGVVILVLVDASGQITQINQYMFLPILGGVFYANNSNWIKHRLQELTPLTIVSVSLLLIGVPMAYILFIQTEFIVKMQTVDGIYQASSFILLLGIAGTGVGYLLSTTLILLTSPVFANTVCFIIPVVALSWGILDGEMLFWGHYVSISIVMGGIYIASQK